MMPSGVPEGNHVIASYNMSWASGAGYYGDNVPKSASEAIFLKRATKPYEFWDNAYDKLMAFTKMRLPSAIGLQEMVKWYGIDKIKNTEMIEENYYLSIGCIPVTGGGEACLVTLTHKRLGPPVHTYIKNLSTTNTDARPILIVHTSKDYILVNLHAPHGNEATVRSTIKSHFYQFLVESDMLNKYNSNKVYVMGDFNMTESNITDLNGLELEDFTLMPGTNLPVKSCCHVSEDSKLPNYKMTGDYCLGVNVLIGMMIVPSKPDAEGRSVASDHEMVWASFYEKPIKAAAPPAPLPYVPAGVKTPAAVPFHMKKVINKYDKYIPKDIPNGFEVRPVPMGEEMLPAYVTTLPKGTLLFRGVRSKETIAQDMGGLINEKTKEYCCSPSYASYFYPFPFFDEAVGVYYSHFIIYVLVTDVKIMCCISPAPFSFSDKTREPGFTSCDKIPRSSCQEDQRSYDMCLTDAFKRTNADVVGIMGFSAIDKGNQMRLAEGKIKQYKNYFNTYLDSHSLKPGIPEIALFPFRSTLAAPFVHEIPNIKEYISKFVYVLNFVPLYTEERTTANIKKAMDDLMSPTGLNGKRAKVNKETGFYQLINFSGVPFPEADSPRFTDPAFRFVRPAPGLAGGNRRTFRRRNRTKNIRKHIV